MTEHDTDVQAWELFAAALADHLGAMTDEDDHLILELPWVGEDDGCAPYAQFAGFGEGTMLRAELSGNAYLAPQFRLDAAQRRALRGRGWRGGNAEEPNWFREAPVTDAARLARRVAKALRHQLHVPHPQLLTYQAWGPAAEHADVLGLTATGDVPVDSGVEEAFMDEESTEGFEVPEPELVQYPRGADALRDLVREELRAIFGEEPVLDDDQDFVLEHQDQVYWVRVRLDMPAIEIMARVVHGVHSRRSTAVELAVLNRDQPWVRWSLRDRSVWQSAMVPAWPFAPVHLRIVLTSFTEQLTRTREDLALRTGGKVA